MTKLRMIRNVLFGWPVVYRAKFESGQLVLKGRGIVADCLFINPVKPKLSLWAAFRRWLDLFPIRRGWAK